MSIRLRLTLWYSGIVASTLLVLGAALYYFISETLQNQVENSLHRHAVEVEERIRFALKLSLKGPNLEIQLDDLDTFLSKEYFLQVVNLVEGRVSRSSNTAKFKIDIPFDDEIQRKLAEGGNLFESRTIRGKTFAVYHKRLVVDGNWVGVLQVAAFTGGNEEFLQHIRRILIGSSLFLLLLAASTGWFLARKALKPIDYLITETDQIEKGSDLNKRISYRGPRDEIGLLTEKINGMLSRIDSVYSELEEAYRAQRRFVSDASHELRTPLTTIRGNVDLLERVWKMQAEGGVDGGRQMELTLEALGDIADEAERMSRLVNDMLSLARADAGYEMVKEPVLLKPLVEEVARRANFLPKQAEWFVGDLSALDRIQVWGNKDYLQQMLFIFIENAFKYTEQGHVSLEAVLSETSEQIGIRICDTGAGMDKDEVPLIFERFYRADPSRGRTAGTGLGLSIARWIIDEHHGSIEVKTKKDEGSTFLIWFPVHSSFTQTAGL